MEYQDFRSAYFRVVANFNRRLPAGSWDYSSIERLLKTVYGRQAVGKYMNRLAWEIDELRADGQL